MSSDQTQALNSVSKTAVSPLNGESLLSLLRTKFAEHILAFDLSCTDAVITVPASGAKQFFQLLKLDAELRLNFLVDITAVDWLDKKEQRYTLVYHLMSLSSLARLRVKIDLPENAPQTDSLAEIWQSANFLEREVYDMFGINFVGHPDLRRILMYDEFKGHPLRKDYPVQGKQPRIKLRHPEVENTARFMKRSELVSINKRK